MSFPEDRRFSLFDRSAHMHMEYSIIMKSIIEEVICPRTQIGIGGEETSLLSWWRGEDGGNIHGVDSAAAAKMST